MFCLYALAFVAAAAAEAPPPDVVVYGATAGGCAAAIAAANEGARVVLVEPGRHVGGMVSGGLGATDFGKQGVIGGMARTYFERLGKHYGEPIAWYFEPHRAEAEFRAWLDQAGVRIVQERRVESVERDGARIAAFTDQTGQRWNARVFIDASYEGDLMARAGVPYTVGREGRDAYGEPLAGRLEHSPKHQFLVPVSARDASGQPLPLVQAAPPGPVGGADKKVQAYNFRLCLTDDPDNQVPFPRPPGYDPARFELLRRYLEAKPDVKLTEILNVREMPSGKTDMNNNGPVSTDYIGGSWDYPEAGYEERARIWEEHKHYVQGLLYFIANDPGVPAGLQSEMRRYGLAKDEFLDTEHWPHQLYVREARRMIGAYVMTERDVRTNTTQPDSIGMGSYNIDSHHVQRFITEDGHAENEGDMQIGVAPYEIAYRILTPKREDAENLLVPVCVSASHVAYSTLRMEPQYMIMGEAAGIAAARAARANAPVQDADVPALQETLREAGAVLALHEARAPHLHAATLPGIVVDNPAAQFAGEWFASSSLAPYVGLDYMHQRESADPGTRAAFSATLPAPGAYAVRIAYTANPNRATNVPVLIRHADGETAVSLNQRKQPAGTAPFHEVGVFRFADRGEVIITSEGVDGYVVADAVQWQKIE